MKAALIFALTATLATSACTAKDDDVRRGSARSLDLGGVVLGADSDLPAPTLAFLGEIKAPKMRSVAYLAVDAVGAIYIADVRGRRVHKISAHGEPLLTIPVREPQGIAVDGAERIFVSDASTGSVRIFSANGEQIGFLGTGEGAFGRPTSLAWDEADDAILVADQDEGAIKVFSTAGSHIFSFGSRGTGPGQFSRVTGIAVDRVGGRYFIVDGGACRIQVFDRAGTFLHDFGSRGSEKTQLTSPGGIALDSVGRLYVTDAFQSILQVLDTEGKHVSYLGEYGHNYGQLNLTTDAVIDSYNRLLVAAYDDSKVVIYGLDDYTEPPRQMPPIRVDLSVTPPTLNGRSRAPYVYAQLGVSQLDITDVVVDSVRLHGLAPEPDAPVSYDDIDGDGADELVLRFSRTALLTALPGPGMHTITLTGDFSTGDTLVGEVAVQVLPEVP